MRAAASPAVPVASALVSDVIAAAGAVLMVLEKTGFKGLPGDIFIQKGNVSFFFPVVTSIVISIALTIALNLFRR